MEGTFLPLVKDGFHDEFLSVWEDWFVLRDTVDQTKKPGLLKSKSIDKALSRLCHAYVKTNFSRMGNNKRSICCIGKQTLSMY